MRNVLLALLLLATSASAADFTGKWSGEGVTNGESHSLYFVLKQNGDTLTGSGGPAADQQHDFKSAKIEGSKIIVDIAVGDKGTLHFELEADGDTLKGTVLFNGGEGTATGPVTLKKIPG
jgi:hypothetical protein